MRNLVVTMACIAACVCGCSLTDVTCGESGHIYDGGCEPNSLEHCGTHEKDCTAFAGASEMACINKRCVAKACEIGYHLEEEVSEDVDRDIACILDTIEACGKDRLNCAEAVPQWVSGKCENGLCMPTECKANHHVTPDRLACEVDSTTGCGLNNANCLVQGVESAECVDGKCSAMACVVGYHWIEQDFLGVCVPDTASACGEAIVDCTRRPGWKDGQCVEGQCQVEACEREYFLSEGECQPNDAKHCGYEEKLDCLSNEGWVVADCVNGECKALSCAEGYHLKESNCVKDSPEVCGVQEINCAALKGWDAAKTSCEGGRCSVSGCAEGFRLSDSSDDKLNGKTCTSNMEAACGPQEVDCTATVPGWETGSCNEGVCVPETCVIGYHMDENGACVADDTEHCGGVDRNCRDIAGVHEVACVEGKCSISACVADFHLEDHESDAYVAEKICAVDTNEACGSEMVKCEGTIANSSSEKCENAKCVPVNCSGAYHLSEDQTKCEKDTELACGSYDNNCLERDGWQTAMCMQKLCEARSCKSNYHIKKVGQGIGSKLTNICVKDSDTKCGLLERNCKNMAGTEFGGTCVNGECVASKCDDTHYLENKTGTCKPSNVNNCGTQGYVCKEKIAQWSTGDCVNNECKLGKCVAGYHVYGNVCERNNVNNCGAHGKACSAQISQWADGDCPDGLCNVSACNSGYHVYGATCEKDSQTNCGKHGNVCTVSWYTFLTGVPSICSNGKCT